MKTVQDLVSAAQQHVTEISVADVDQLPQGVVVIDVREPSELAQGTLPNAINVPRGVLEFKIGSLEGINLQTNILVYCQVGGRSALAAQSLQALGYSNVTSLAGGFDAWHKTKG